jgi:hypothetical protein
MAITSAARTAINQVLTTWETGSPTGGYNVIDILTDGAGFSGGRHQATVKGGNLPRILQTYIDRCGKFAPRFREWLPRLKDSIAVDAEQPLPQWCLDFMNLWRQADAEDPRAFREAQDQVFDSQYWGPMAQQAEDMKLVLPLSWGVCYDICIQSGPNGLPDMRNLFRERPPSGGGSEMAWTNALISARRKWLENFVSSKRDPKLAAAHTKIVRKTVYRMDGWAAVSKAENWTLVTPFVVPLQTRTITIPG